MRKTGTIQNIVTTSPGTDYAFMNEFIGKMKEKILQDPKATCISDNDPDASTVRSIMFQFIGQDHKLIISAVTEDYDAYQVATTKYNSNDVLGSARTHTVGVPYTKQYDLFYDDDKSIFMIAGASAGSKETVFTILKIAGIEWGSGEYGLMTGASSGSSESSICANGGDQSGFPIQLSGGYAAIDGKFMFFPVFMLTLNQNAMFDKPIKDLYEFWLYETKFKPGTVISDDLFYYVGCHIRMADSGATATKWIRFAR